MVDPLSYLAIQLVNSIMRAAGDDAYREIRNLVIKRLRGFRDNARLERSIDATRRRLIVHPNYAQAEASRWLKELTTIAEASPAASQAVRSLEVDVRQLIAQQNVHQSGPNAKSSSISGSFHGSQYNLFVDASNPASFGNDGLEDEKENEGSSGGPSVALVALILLVVVVTILVAKACSGSPAPRAPATDPFPKHGSRWPQGATFAAIMAPISERFSACIQAPLLAPVNCPQSLTYSDTSNVSAVHWNLYGDPTDGARIEYVRKEFQIAGNAILRVTYTDSGGAELAIQLMHYRAWVSWNAGHPSLSNLITFIGGSPPRITKHDPHVAWARLENAVRVAFHNCVIKVAAPLPPQCPTEPGSAFNGSNAHWQLDNNPLANAQAKFDSTWGFINVTGSFAMSASYSVFLFGERHSIETGNYRAIVALDGANVDVLTIIAT